MQANGLVCDNILRIDMKSFLLCYLSHSLAHRSDCILYSTHHLLPRALPFLRSKLWAAQNLFKPADKYIGSPPRSFLLLLEVGLSRCHHLYHKQSDQGSIHLSNHRIQILLPFYASQSLMRQSSPYQVDSLKRMNVFLKLGSSSHYSTAQTSPLFYLLFSYRRHWPTETCCKLLRPLIPPRATESSLETFHLLLLGLTLLRKSEITA